MDTRLALYAKNRILWTNEKVYIEIKDAVSSAPG